MSRAAITLGVGHPAGDDSGGTLLDVHLHPDCALAPLSLGERWGRGPGVGAQFTLQEAAGREAGHLQACGCGWLVTLAAEERRRDVLTEGIVRDIVTEWNPSLPWRTKDAWAALLQDQTAECVLPVFRDALRSPTAETRAYALCILTGDFEQFTSLLNDDSVDAAKVDAAIAAARHRL